MTCKFETDLHDLVVAQVKDVDDAKVLDRSADHVMQHMVAELSLVIAMRSCAFDDPHPVAKRLIATITEALDMHVPSYVENCSGFIAKKMS